MHARQHVLVDIAKDPHLGEVGNGEQRLLIVERANAGAGGDLLIDDDSGDRSAQWQQRRGIVDVAAQNFHVRDRGLEIDLGLV